ncbi:MAG: LacI family DNA-binding transcriptional regulator [Lactobacillus sp.]|nr:LacI family DNA-binding transcriptional regulator [Lactobacillus sp.]
MVTIKEIAEKSGYSAATVSRLLNNDPKLSVSQTTKNKIIKVAHELGYFEQKQVNIKPNLALLYRVNGNEHLQDEYFAFLKNSIKQTARKESIELDTFTEAEELLKSAESYQGFIGVGTGKLTYSTLKKLKKVLPNGVFIDINPAPKLFDSVQPNLSLTIQDALDRISKKGYQTVGYIGAESFTLDGKSQRDIREITFSEYSKLKNFKEIKVFSSGIVSVENGRKLAEQAINDCKKLPKAFVIASDTLSVGVLQVFNEHGIKVPQDTAIISINNSDVSQYVSPPLSTYNIDQNAMAQIAFDTLQSKINHPDRPTIHLTMNTDLVIRKSFE